MNCLSLTIKKPAKGKTKRADNTRAIWTKEWNTKGQLPSRAESNSRSPEVQQDEHSVIAGIPDNRRLIMITRMICFLALFITWGQKCRKYFETFSDCSFFAGLGVWLSCLRQESYLQTLILL